MSGTPVPVPEGVLPFYLSDGAAKKYELKTGPAINDLVPRKEFHTHRLLEEIGKYGVMCQFEPCASQLKECNLETVVIVCDVSARYGEKFLLLHSPESIASFRLDDDDDDQENDADVATSNISAIEHANAIMPMTTTTTDSDEEENVERILQPNPYVSETEDETTEEIESMRVRSTSTRSSQQSTNSRHNIVRTVEKRRRGGEMGPSNGGGSNSNNNTSTTTTIAVASIEPNQDVDGTETAPPGKISDTSVQSVPLSTTASSQTYWRRKVNKITQYQAPKLEDFGYDKNLAQENNERVAASVKRVTPLFERALQENEIVDIFSSYLDLPDKGDMSNFRRVEVDDGLIEVRNFTDLEYSKGKHIQYIDIHPTRPDVIAASVCDPASMDEIIPQAGMPRYSYVIVWQFGLQMRPLWILRAPLDCPVFCFSPTQPNIIVGGCRNGQMVMWDTDGASSLDKPPLYEPGRHSTDPEKRTGASSSSSSTSSSSRDGRRTNTVLLLPKALSFPEHGHKFMIHDISWLPPHIHINAKGDLLGDEHLSDISHQFFTVSGDGQIIFWDIRYQEIMRGELPYIAKVKSTRHLNGHEEDGDFPSMRWMPIFKIKPKRLEGTGELSLCRAFKVVGPNDAEKSSEIICTSEEGDLLSVDWCPKRGESRQDGSGKELDRDFASQEYVQWMKKDHDRPCISLGPVAFFPSFLLTASDWNFHIWEINGEKKSSTLIFTSADASSYITGAKWSPKRPGVLFVSKVDGSIDIWDFTESCYAPHTTIPLIPTRIVSMEFLIGPKDDTQMLAIGDSVGTLHVFEIPRNLAQTYPNEFRTMQSWLDREVKIQQSRETEGDSSSGDDESVSEQQFASDSMPNLSGSKVPSEVDKVENEKEPMGLTDEEEAEYLAFERSFLE